MASNFPDNGPVIIAVTWWLCFFCGGFMAIRLYAKFSRNQWLWWDDYVLIFSWTMLLVESIFTQLGCDLGFGKHYYDIDPMNLTTIALYTSVVASTSCLASTGSKISWGITLLRLTDRWWQRFVWFAIGTLFAVMIPSAFFVWAQCMPLEKFWNTTVEGHCWDTSITVNYGYFNTAWCCFMDFALAFLSWRLIWKLNMRAREKVGVGIAMSLGILSGVCTIIKGIYLAQLRQADFYYVGKDVTIWTVVETATAIIAASLPVLRVMFKEALSTNRYNNVGSNEIPMSRLNDTKRTIRGTTSNSAKSSRGGVWSSSGNA